MVVEANVSHRRAREGHLIPPLDGSFHARRCDMELLTALKELPLQGAAIIAGVFALVTYGGWIAGRS